MVLVCISLIISNIVHLFICLLTILFGEVSIQEFCPFFDWVFFSNSECLNYLYILDSNPLLVTSFASIFSHSVDCLFILLMVSLLFKSFEVELGPICLFFLSFLLPLGPRMKLMGFISFDTWVPWLQFLSSRAEAQ